MFSILRRNLFLLLIIPAIGIFLWISNSKIPESKQVESVPSEDTLLVKEQKQERSETVIVDVKGAVRHPGVYKTSPDSRVNDVIKQAGGFTADADQKMVNLAQKVQDEMLILIPEKGENIPSMTTGPAGDGKVRVNYATQEEIETLNGIGPSKAQAIIEYRDENGLFQKVEDLLEVSGIGEKTLENLRDFIQIP
ncbi:helix-hairpin-helix domain-containing protein [Virgibacillus kekensis]|uniref:Helix-hairpin-helix domain-containing protein n=1 Tax=Virgibacillus kekensis TaxID=202261 RepID=A0ABV9DLC9_9BACI